MSEMIEMPEMPSSNVKEYLDSLERRLHEEMTMPVSLLQKKTIGRSPLADAMEVQHRFNRIIDAQREHFLLTLPETPDRELLF